MPRREIPRAQLFVSPGQREWWREKRASLGIGREYAIVHPTALYATKQWSAENFARLGAFLERDAGLHRAVDVAVPLGRRLGARPVDHAGRGSGRAGR